MESRNPPQSTKKIKLNNGEQSPCLPEQVIMEEILPRLPVKSLLKFRCVSKPWCSLIGSKRFMKAHLKNSIKNAHQLILFDNVEKRFKQCCLPSLFDNPVTYPITHNADLGIDFKSKRICVVGCCNGLVCILMDSERFILWNPTTKKLKNLPDFNSEMGREIIGKFGFGFDEWSDDYKVFVSVICVKGKVASGKVYSLRSNSWKDIEERDVYEFGGDAGMHVSGKLHWCNYNCGISSFDLSRHVYGVVELPSYIKGFLCWVGVIGGCLSAHLFHPNGDLDVWLMKEYGVKESWDKVVTLPRYSNPVYREIPTPLAIAPNGEVLLIYDSAIMIYNPKSNVFRHTQITGLDDLRDHIAGIYVESLASVES